MESELPSGYGNVTLSASTFSYRATGLLPGQLYTVRLSALNARGYGQVATSTQLRLPLQVGHVRAPTLRHALCMLLSCLLQSPCLLELFLFSPHAHLPRPQVPSTPTALSVSVYPGDSTKLLATYSAPVSDGGTPVTKYVIEWSQSPDFTTFGTVEYRCPNNPLYEVVTVTTTSTGTIQSGTFSLTVNNAGQMASTLAIPYNAVANAEDEAPGNLASDVFNTGGSMQSFMEALPNVGSVRVTRQDLTAGKFTWSITFLDQV